MPNNSAYFGMIKYEQYSEPLVVSGAKIAGNTDSGLDFMSIHSASMGSQNSFVEPRGRRLCSSPCRMQAERCLPMRVSIGFSFGGGGPLMWNGENKFWAC